jgi:single-strand DNA-binding protein
MKDLNRIILIGRLGADPIQRETKSGMPVVQFPLATSRRIKGDGGEVDAEGGIRDMTEETVWHRVIAWGRQGEACAQHLRKGQSVYVEGSLRSHKYTGKDNVQRMAFEVHAESVGFLGGSARLARRDASGTEEAAIGEGGIDIPSLAESG